MNHYQSAEMIKDLTQALGDYDATRRAERRRDDRSDFPMKENEDLGSTSLGSLAWSTTSLGTIIARVSRGRKPISSART
ncbi:hypothetical protein EJ06DRAFT_242030 [Trichodelitschia bisporula]|uniref:Uncharacterized protein n=1 Tax=Trichodelitschia bisporula TaxID=703511 RepID=A0A6G1HKQ8_9PEZI|nr:hypothetical protein EJ06DRAFT_242030 [Trichodelitschia bisporula]